jgi:hypothetical protein
MKKVEEKLIKRLITGTPIQQLERHLLHFYWDIKNDQPAIFTLIQEAKKEEEKYLSDLTDIIAELTKRKYGIEI